MLKNIILLEVLVMFKLMDNVEFENLSFDDKKQYLIDVIENMDDNMVKRMHEELDSVGAFDMNPNSSEFKEALKKLANKYEDEV